MINKRILEIILSEQVQELAVKAQMALCKRKEEDLVNLNSNMAQVVIGVRRSGKSTLCFNVLRHAGVKYAYVNFDDERLEGLSAKDLNTVLEVLYKINGDFSHLFLDEIQNVNGWHLFVNRMLRQGMKILITGSNAKLLSGELATHLTGRHNPIELLPFSFSEYCAYKGIDTTTLTTKAEALRRGAFDAYLAQGGFPELLLEDDNKQYVGNLVDNIIKRDIRQRYRIRYFAAFERMAHHLMNVAPTLLAPADLTATFGFGSSQTTNNYIQHLKQAYLLVGLSKYSAKSKLRVTDEKVYTVDVALMDKCPDAFVGENLGWRLETVVYIELRRRTKADGYDIYYYKKHPRAKEVDFVVCKGNKAIRMYQVAYDITNGKTRKREITSLVQASQSLNCKELYLITDYERDTVKQGDCSISIIPAHEWLLEQ
ncbi:MAG: ATP-binding protein [Candidatus Limimorpha sp.]